MISVVSARRRLHGWRALAIVALAAASLPAAAQSMACGTYRQDDGHAILSIESEGYALLKPAYSSAEELRVARSGNVLGMVNLATGRMENWTFGDGDDTLNGGYHGFMRDQPAACKPFRAVQEGSCRADPVACLENILEAAPAQLRQWCSEDVPVACNRLAELYQREADDAAPQDSPPFAIPAQCDETGKRYDPRVCMRLMEAVASEVMAKSLVGLSRAAQATLPAAQRAELAGLCRQHPREAFCHTVAQAQWNAGQLLDAREALQLACSERSEAYACSLLAPLVGLSAAALSPLPSTALPCGTYHAERGVLQGLQFGDAGVVEVTGYATRLRARVQDGRIHLRRDVGDDFVLQAVADGSLVGMHGDIRFAHYTRQTGTPDTCSPPPAFTEIPLPLDCPTLDRNGGAEACCKAGQLLGCKIAAQARTRDDDWKGAQRHFLTLCSAGVREGCIGLAEVYPHTADPAVPKALQAICAKDGSNTHAACDVDATRNWPAMRQRAEEAMRSE